MRTQHNRFATLQQPQRTLKRRLAEILPVHHLVFERLEVRRPANGQTAFELGLQPGCFVIEGLAALVRALLDGSHGRRRKQLHGLVNVFLRRNGRKARLGNRLGDAHNGLELTHGNGNRRARVGHEFGRVHFLADRDEAGRQLLGSLGAEARSAATIKIYVSMKRFQAAGEMGG